MEFKKYYNNLITDLFLNLIASYCNEDKIIDLDKLELDDDKINKLMKLSKFQSLEYLIISSLELNNINISNELKKIKNTLYFKCVTQMCELESIKEELCKNKIYHLPLKGSIIRTYYPDPASREMADIDILVHKDEIKKVSKLLLKDLGYSKVAINEDAPHDSFKKLPFMEVEVHKKLMVDDSKLSKYLLKTWDRVTNKEYTSLLNNEDFYIYNIMHNAKHFSKGGTGIRIIIDLFYLSKKINYDYEYIKNELKKFDLDRYEVHLRVISNKLFNNELLDEDELFLLGYFIGSGTYGTVENDVISHLSIENDSIENKEFNKKKYFWKKVFPPYSIMKGRNPILKKIPILLPWFWFTRLLKGIFHFKDHKNTVNKINNISEIEIERRKKIESLTGINASDF